MELPSQGEMALPLNSSYGGGGHGHTHSHGHGHMIHHDPVPAAASHNHIIPSSAPQIQLASNNNGPISSTVVLDHQDHVPFKKMVRYRECLKNHAASMGGNATDGCGEFMPSGEEGSLEALTCSACNCHRNFHRKEIEGEPPSSPCDCFHNPHHLNRVGRKVIVGHHHKGLLGPETLGYPISSRAAPPHPMIMSYNMGSIPSESDEQDEAGGGAGGGGGGGGGGVVTRPPHQLVKKRFRTKFTQEQKEKLLNFAEKVGWKIQKQEEGVVQQFCQEVGVKRRVLKVWMHNNKHNLAKKNSVISNIISPQNQV